MFSRSSPTLNAIPHLRTIVILASLVFLGSRSVFAQSMPGFQAPDQPIVKKDVRLEAERGQAPLIKLYGNLTPESSKIKRLPALDSREYKRRTFEKLLQVGMVRQLTLN